MVEVLRTREDIEALYDPPAKVKKNGGRGYTLRFKRLADGSWGAIGTIGLPVGKEVLITRKDGRLVPAVIRRLLGPQGAFGQQYVCSIYDDQPKTKGTT